MNFETIFAGSTILALLAAFWARIKEWGRRLTGAAIERTEFHGLGATEILRWILTDFRRMSVDGSTIGSNYLWIRPRKVHGPVFSEQMPKGGGVFWKGWRWLRVEVAFDTVGEGAAASRTSESGALKLSWLRGTFSAEMFMQAATDRYFDHREIGSVRYCLHPRFGVSKDIYGREAGGNPAKTAHQMGGPVAANNGSLLWTTAEGRYFLWKADEIGPPPVASGAHGHLCLTPFLATVLSESHRWRDSAEWHRDRLVPWTLGWLFQGPPGTGKSSLAKVIAQKLDVPIYSPSLATYNNRDLSRLWDELRTDTPCILLLEDIDAIFDQRVCVAKDCDLTFDCLLNHLSGVADSEGIMTIVTTNAPEKIDPALRRSGRIDHVVDFGPLTIEQRQDLAARILPEWPEDAARAVLDGAGQVGADFQRRCIDIAQAKFRAQSVFGRVDG